jgi:uncharacterized protein YeaC (DUF1315 family)
MTSSAIAIITHDDFRYINNPRDALTEFYMARKDSDWGEKVIHNMVEIWINPDNVTLTSEGRCSCCYLVLIICIANAEKKDEEKDKTERMKAINSAKELLKVYHYSSSALQFKL